MLEWYVLKVCAYRDISIAYANVDKITQAKKKRKNDDTDDSNNDYGNSKWKAVIFCVHT